ncbi:MAG: hypothetical protein IPI33_04840 [Dehalococcoidia bacterium]|nr:hypothetical protein [Dehalococcoidia bacterium]
MTEIPTFGDRSTRKLTYEERVSRDRLVATGVVDVTNPIELAPDEFWNAVAQALSWHVLDLQTDSIRTKMPAIGAEVRWTLEMRQGPCTAAAIS